MALFLSLFFKKVPNGVTNATAEYKKFKCADDKEFEVSYCGPTGSGGVRGKPIGCKPFFDKLNFDSNRAKILKTCIEEFENAASGSPKRNGDDDENNDNNNNNTEETQLRFHAKVLDGLVKLVVSFCEAHAFPEYVTCVLHYKKYLSANCVLLLLLFKKIAYSQPPPHILLS